MDIDEHAESRAKNEARMFQTNTAIKSEHLTPCMSEVVDSDEEFSSNYIQTHQSSTDPPGQLPQETKVPTNGLKISENDQRKELNKIFNGEMLITDANFVSLPAQTPTVHTVKG